MNLKGKIMKITHSLVAIFVASAAMTGGAKACEQCGGKGTAKLQKTAATRPAVSVRVTKTPDLVLTGASVTYLRDLDMLVFEQKVQGTAGGIKPRPRGQMNGAPVLGYVFPTSLKSQDVGWSPTAGIVALAVTSHPDFDDSPLWDENNDGKTGNDGLVYHSHWVILTSDKRVPGGFSVKEFKPAKGIVLPPTAPKMPMFMDSPGYSVALRGDTLRVMVPASRINNRTAFKYDAVTAYMEVSTRHGKDSNKPMLGVYEVFSVLSGNLSLPYSVKSR
jgi:hypothetical protein